MTRDDPIPAADLIAPRDREDERLHAEQLEAEELADRLSRHSDHLNPFIRSAPLLPSGRGHSDEASGPYHPGPRARRRSPAAPGATSSMKEAA